MTKRCKSSVGKAVVEQRLRSCAQEKRCVCGEASEARRRSVGGVEEPQKAPRMRRARSYWKPAKMLRSFSEEIKSPIGDVQLVLRIASYQDT
eukprot:6192296-Pleurochrysis_carterae.AAC.4